MLVPTTARESPEVEAPGILAPWGDFLFQG